MKKNKEVYLPYGKQNITKKDIEAVVEVLKSPLITQGPVVSLFEKEIANKIRVENVIAVNSATSALHIACLALGLQEGDWLWTSPITFVASANCGLYCKAYIDFVDINPLTGLMSIEALKIKLQKAEIQGKLPKVLVPVHLAGASCDMKAINDLAKKYKFSVIEDASHAIGGKYNNKPVGSCEYSDICVFSLHPVKIITTGEGGLATTNNKILAEKMFDLRSHGITRDKNRFKRQSPGPWAYEQQSLGFNYRMTDFQAALGISQLKRLKKIVSERNKQYIIYDDLLADLPVNLLKIMENVLSSVHLGIIRLEDSSVKSHIKVFKYLRDAGIGVQLHYSPVHLQPYFRDKGFNDGDFPESEAYAKSSFSLPLYPGLKNHEIKYVVKMITKALDV